MYLPKTEDRTLKTGTSREVTEERSRVATTLDSEMRFHAHGQGTAPGANAGRMRQRGGPSRSRQIWERGIHIGADCDIAALSGSPINQEPEFGQSVNMPGDAVRGCEHARLHLADAPGMPPGRRTAAQ